MLNDTILIAGAGLSSVAGLPTTRKLTEFFLNLDATDATKAPLQNAISNELRKFWKAVFNYEKGPATPTFEDHFTVLDLSANTGHHLGRDYSARKLRAIRRLSLHRVFDTLDSKFKESEALERFLNAMATGKNNAIVTTNWDVAIERVLGDHPFHYDIPIDDRDGNPPQNIEGLPLLKLHGSSNWAYCDCCRRLIAYRVSRGKGAAHWGVFIDRADFEALGQPDVPIQIGPSSIEPLCRRCSARLSSRVATFSYAKTLEFAHFVAIWESALQRLRHARHWVFVGYSFPDADFELRHLLKVAEIAHASGD